MFTNLKTKLFLCFALAFVPVITIACFGGSDNPEAEAQTSTEDVELVSSNMPVFLSDNFSYTIDSSLDGHTIRDFVSFNDESLGGLIENFFNVVESDTDTSLTGHLVLRGWRNGDWRPGEDGSSSYFSPPENTIVLGTTRAVTPWGLNEPKVIDAGIVYHELIHALQYQFDSAYFVPAIVLEGAATHRQSFFDSFRSSQSLVSRFRTDAFDVLKNSYPDIPREMHLEIISGFIDNFSLTDTISYTLETGVQEVFYDSESAPYFLGSAFFEFLELERNGSFQKELDLFEEIGTSGISGDEENFEILLREKLDSAFENAYGFSLSTLEDDFISYINS